MKEPLHRRPGIPASPYRPLAGDEVKEVAQAAFDILDKSGVAVYTDTGFEAFRAAGANVDEQTRRVRLSRSMVEDALASNPSSVTLWSRDGQCDAVLEGNRVHYGTGGTAIYVLDPDTGERRPSTTDDVVLNARMVDALDNLHVFTINVFPHDVKDTEEIDVNGFFHSFDNNTKHVM